MKSQIRAIGIDDSPFTFKTGRTEVYGVIARLPGYIEQVVSTEVEVDGRDATDCLVQLVAATGMAGQLECAFLDGGAVGGFNVVDIERLNRETGVPVITVTRDRPDMPAVLAALKGHFDDWEERYSLLASHELLEVDTGHNPIFVSLAGIEEAEARELIAKSLVRGAIPEPLRLAHAVASRKRL